MVRSTSQLFDPSTLGVKGRRAGTTLSHDIPRDKQGLEEIDAYFADLEKQRDTPRRYASSPAKSPKSNKKQSKVGKFKSEAARRSIAKPSSSLSRSHTISSPAKRQPSSSSQKSSSKTKTIFKNLFGNDRPVSSSSRSRLSESDEEEQTPRVKSAKKSQKRVIESLKESQSQNEGSEDDNLPDTQRDEDEVDNSDAESAHSDDSAGEQAGADEISGSEDDEEEQEHHEEENEESDSDSIPENSPPPPPPPLKKTKTSKAQAKPSKKPTPLKPKSANARVTKPVSKPVPKVNKAKPKQRTSIPSPSPDDDGPRGVRRSRREKRAPLQYWRGEKLHVQLDKDGETIRVEALTKPPEEIVPIKKKTYTHRPYQDRRSRRDESEDEDSDFEMEPRVVADVFEYPNEDQKRERIVSWAPKNIKYLDVKNSSYSLATLYDQDSSFNAGGMIKIKVHGEKPLKPSKMNNYIFYIASGRVEVTISNRTFRLKSGGSFEVPRGNWYSIVNISKTREAVLFFVQSTDTEFNNDGDESSAQGDESAISD